MATLLALPASFVSRAHTALSAFAFATALGAGYASGLWEALCDNAVAKWPVEWFPSVSATIGDHAATRAPFQILIALTATPRFVLLALQWLAHRYPPAQSKRPLTETSFGTSTATYGDGARRRKDKDDVDAAVLSDEPAVARSSTLVDAEFMIGVARTFCCGGWMYITSRDQHDLHDLFMIVYIVLNVPWMVLSTLHSTNDKAKRWRMVCAGGFMGFLPPLIHLFIKHSVKRVPGAYTHYAFFEWSLVMWDVAFDAGCLFELDHLQLKIVDTSRAGADSVKNGSAGKIFLEPVQIRTRVEEDWTAKPSAPSRIPQRDLVAYLSDVWFAAIFWTVFTGVSVQLFYYSVWSLSLTGSELAVLINIAPYALQKQGYRAYALSREGGFTHRAIMYGVGLGCYAIPSVPARFLCILVAMWCGWMSFMADSMRLRGSPEMLAQGKIFVTGLVLCMVCKYNAYSNNPFWAIVDEKSGGWNKTGLAVSALALAEYYYRPNNLFPAPPVDVKDKPVAVQATRAQRLAIVFGLGSLVHLLQTFGSDAGTVIAWTWTGFPATGPSLHPWAGFIIAAAALGIVTNVNLPAATIGLPFMAAGALVLFPDWIGYAGGLVLTTWLIAAVSVIFQAASALPPKVWGHAMAWNAFMDVASVFTVAYAFVPLGWILRERTDVIIVMLLAPLPPCLMVIKSLVLPGDEMLTPRSARRLSNVFKWTQYAAGALAVSGLLSATYYTTRTAPMVKPTPFLPEHNIFTGGIFTVHFGIDEPGRDSQRRISDLVREMQVDVLGMLETDLHRFVYGNRDLTRYMAEELGYYVDLGPGPNQHTWGACLLSKYPIINSTHHLLPSPHGELAPAIHATLDVRGQRVDVIVSHNGQEEDPLDRELQTKELARLLQLTGDTPTVFLGYLVTKLFEPPPSPYGILFNNDTGLIDIEDLDQYRWCEYIGFRGLWRIGFARLEHSDVTDTELQVAKFVLPLPGQKVHYDTHQDLYWHMAEDLVPEPWRFPTMFRDDGVRGHSYRIWNGPLYYLPPYASGVRGYGWNWSTEWPPAPE